jgi:hypothetical protein
MRLPVASRLASDRAIRQQGVAPSNPEQLNVRLGVPHRFVDTTSVTLTGIEIGVMLADGITTQNLLNKYPTEAQEANPLARPFVNAGWPGMIAGGAMVVSADMALPPTPEEPSSTRTVAPGVPYRGWEHRRDSQRSRPVPTFHAALTGRIVTRCETALEGRPCGSVTISREGICDCVRAQREAPSAFPGSDEGHVAGVVMIDNTDRVLVFSPTHEGDAAFADSHRLFRSCVRRVGAVASAEAVGSFDARVQVSAGVHRRRRMRRAVRQ